MSVSVSVLILTLNEELNLPACIEAVSWCDDIVVLDSFSTDKTVEIAEKYGARLYKRKFDNFASQRNYALENITFKHEWILHIDADEIITDELMSEIEQNIRTSEYDAFQIPSKTILFGKWLRFSGMYPTYQVRLGRHPFFRFKQVGHGQRENIDYSKVGTLKNPYIHYSFLKGIDDWFEKHNRYSQMEAEETIRHMSESRRIVWLDLFSSYPVCRRRALKAISYRLPFRPIFRFFYMYFLRLGFLDGSAGLTYCCLIAVYEYMIVAKVKEQRAKSRDERVAR